MKRFTTLALSAMLVLLAAVPVAYAPTTQATDGSPGVNKKLNICNSPNGYPYRYGLKLIRPNGNGAVACGTSRAAGIEDEDLGDRDWGDTWQEDIWNLWNVSGLTWKFKNWHLPNDNDYHVWVCWYDWGNYRTNWSHAGTPNGPNGDGGYGLQHLGPLPKKGQTVTGTVLTNFWGGPGSYILYIKSWPSIPNCPNQP